MGSNPAGLGYLTYPTLDVSLVGVARDGILGAASSDPDGRMYGSASALPEVAWARPMNKDNDGFGVGLAVIPESLWSAQWQYADPAGGMDGQTSYGSQRNAVRMTVVRGSAGVGFSFGSVLAVGGSLGWVYNETVMQGPYVFQSTATGVGGFKTLMDLRTNGVGINGSGGLLLRIHPRVQFGGAYVSKTVIHGKGDAYGNASAQLNSLGGVFAGADPLFHYDLETLLVLPARAGGGLAVLPHKKWLVSAQADWYNWADAFDQLDIDFLRGTNAALNALSGSDRLNEVYPFKWENRVVVRGGLEFSPTRHARFRAGYAQGKSPVPEEYLTPLWAFLPERSASVGAGYRSEQVKCDFAYQMDFARAQTIQRTRLLAGENAGQRLRTVAHTIAITLSTYF